MSTRVELTHATVLFSGRADGDLGRTSGDIPAAVARNRAALVERCGVRAVAAGRQVHGSVVAVDGPKLTVDFDRAGRKMVLDSFVSAAG